MVIVDAHCTIGHGRYVTLSAEALIAEMDEVGIAKAVVGPVHEHMTVYNREGNDYILEAVRCYPERLVGFATVNPWYGQVAVDELERALDAGLRGVTLNSSLQGFFIHDELVHPIMRVAEERRVPVYFHTATPIHALPFQLAELAQCYPAVDVIMGHVAAADYWTDVVPSASLSNNIYVETSLRSGVGTIRQTVDALGANRVLFGSSAPESSMGVELAKIRRVGLAPWAEELVLGRNMLRLLGEGTGT